MMTQCAKTSVAALVGFLAIDMLWLGVVARGFNRRHLEFLLADQVNLTAAVSGIGYLVGSWSR